MHNTLTTLTKSYKFTTSLVRRARLIEMMNSCQKENTSSVNKQNTRHSWLFFSWMTWKKYARRQVKNTNKEQNI